MVSNFRRDKELHGTADSASACQEVSPFMEPEHSLPCRQETATEPYPEPDEFQLLSTTSHLISLIVLKILCSHLRVDLSSGLFLSSFPIETSSTMCAMCLADFFILEVMALIFGEEYR